MDYENLTVSNDWLRARKFLGMNCLELSSLVFFFGGLLGLGKLFFFSVVSSTTNFGLLDSRLLVALLAPLDFVFNFITDRTFFSVFAGIF